MKEFISQKRGRVICTIVMVCIFSLAGVADFCKCFGQGNSLNREREVWIEETTGMKFVHIAEGCFFMGSPRSEEGRDSDEGPVHEVCVSDFWIGMTEVSVKEFEVFVKSTGYKTDAEKEGYSWVYTGKWEKKKGFDWKHPGYEQDGNHPVVNVSWNDAKRMASWLTAKTGKVFRLPTEAEWEYACRGGTGTSRFWGDMIDGVCAYANVADKSARKTFPAWCIHECDDGFVFTSRCASFKPNPFGIYDMLGNVWEWCEDNYLVDAYWKHAKYDPLIRKKDVTEIVIRGGSWYSRPRYVRCASRDHLHNSRRRGNDVGFRLVMKP